MTARIDLIPSPYDRLDPVARTVRWWTSQMADLIGAPMRKRTSAEAIDGGKRTPGRIAVALPETDAFVATLVLPRGPATAHRKAIELRLPELAPTDPNQLDIAATAIDQRDDGAITYAVAMARRGRLDGLELAARRKGARNVIFHAGDLDAAELKSPATRRRALRSLVIDGGLAAAILAAAVAAIMSWTAYVEADAQRLAEQERNLRRAAVAAETTRRDADIAREFVNRGVLDRRAGVVLQTLAQLSAATPEGASWTLIKWTPAEITIEAQAKDATRAIEAISGAAKGWIVELSGTINKGSGDAPQSFELKVRPRPQGPQQ